MDLAALLDPASAAIVVGGTCLATVLRCGLGNCRLAVVALAQRGHPAFDAQAVRAEMAVQVREIQKDGLVRAHPLDFGDRDFEVAADAMIAARSVEALVATHSEQKTRRMETARRAVATLAQASELAPVFGLAGTLISLSQLPGSGVAKASFGDAISMAVLTTLYGLLLANVVLAPLARLVERAAAAEESERQAIIDWLAAQVDRSRSHRRGAGPEPVDRAA